MAEISKINFYISKNEKDKQVLFQKDSSFLINKILNMYVLTRL
jgi:hypothetical protein